MFKTWQALMLVLAIALVTFNFARAQADDLTPEVPKVQLASMGLAGLQPMSDAAGNQVRGNCAFFGGSGPIGIPLASASGAQLVVRLNWSYFEELSDLRTVILLQLLEEGDAPEPIPPGRLEF